MCVVWPGWLEFDPSFGGDCLPLPGTQLLECAAWREARSRRILAGIDIRGSCGIRRIRAQLGGPVAHRSLAKKLPGSA